MTAAVERPPVTPLPSLALRVTVEEWPLAEPFVIARGAKSAARVVIATVEGEGCRGRGEAVPYARYGETVEDALATLEASAPHLARGLDWTDLAVLLPPGAARNALDCALWDWAARHLERPVWSLIGGSRPHSIPTFFTISLDRPEAMADAAAAAARDVPRLKLKLGDATDDAARLEAVRKAAPHVRLIVDANEGWTMADLERLAPLAHRLEVEVIEQPLAAGDDAALAGFESPVPLCADESFHGTSGLARLRGLYQAVNIKLDKAGGLSSARHLADEARALGFEIMLGSMVATSLGLAPALLLAGDARWVDLDGPLLLARDRVPGLGIRKGVIAGLPAGLWGFIPRAPRAKRPRRSHQRPHWRNE